MIRCIGVLRKGDIAKLVENPLHEGVPGGMPPLATASPDLLLARRQEW